MKRKVLLLSMPFGALDRQGLGVSLLKAILLNRGVDCDLRYLTFPFAELIGCETYSWIASELPYTAFAGDWLFTEALYGPRPRVDREYVDDVLRRTWQLPEEAIERLFECRRLVAPFLEYCLEAIPWSEYAIVGFTSTFEQNIASLALVRRIKVKFPRVVIVFGGANWEGEMGVELHRRFDFVDFACSGEADESFPSLVSALRAKPGTPAALPHGLVYRSGADTRATAPAPPVTRMDALPFPDFTDYFDQLYESSAASLVLPKLLFESSRGCWWGAKSHCTFCGLNGAGMVFRAKSPDRAYEEICYLVDRWAVTTVEAVDNILDMKYFQSFLPKLEQSGRTLDIFYEVKANLRREHVELLAKAGVGRIQPGIESLSDRILKLMRKGTTALQNVQLLKWCAEYGIHADWNLLYGFPGETRADYDSMVPLLRAVEHLTPPAAMGPIRLDRFSPYHRFPDEFGFRNVRPLMPYRYLYPFDAGSLSRIAYYFDYDYAPGLDPRGASDEVREIVDAWSCRRGAGSLTAVADPAGALTLIDGRKLVARRIVLSGMERRAYEYCDRVQTTTSILTDLRERYPHAPLEAASVKPFLDSLADNNLLVQNGSHVLALATRCRTVSHLEASRGFDAPGQG